VNRTILNQGQLGTRSAENRAAIITLQLLNGGLVTLGGFAFFVFALNSLGNALGLVHFSVGVVGLLAGVLALIRSEIPSNLLLAVNGIVIAYSSLAEVFVEVDSLLPPSAASDSLIGTVAALIMGGLVIYLIHR
jgi:hypothetical protein